MTRFLIPVLTLSIVCAAALHADERAEQLRALHAKYADKVVVLTWTSTTSAMGQTIESKSATTGLVVGEGGLVLISAQPLTGGVGGMASAFGGGGTGPENFKLHTADGKEHTAREALKADGLNLRFHGAPIGKADVVTFNAAQAIPALGEEVVIIGAHDEALNYARFFRTARINCVVENGKYYGLDGSVADCLGGIVLSLDGKVLGVVGQKKGKDEPAAGGGGFGRMLGGLNDPGRAIGNRVLVTAAVFAEDLKSAQKVVLAEGFHDGAVQPVQPRPERTPTPAPAGGFEGTVANANYRERQQDVFVLIDVKTGPAPAMDDKVSILDAAGKEVATLTISRRYNSDAMDLNSPINQVGGFIADPERKLKIEKGMKVVVHVEKPAPAPSAGFRGVERFTRIGEDVLKDNFGGIKVGFSVSQIPDKDSPTREAGLRSGDVIYKVNDFEITTEHTLQDFLKLLREAEGDVKLSIVRRGGEKLEITVKP